MDSGSEIAYEFRQFFHAYKDGRVERLFGTDIVPPQIDPQSDGISSKDVPISTETGVSARISIPTSIINAGQKRPILIYFHGGGFFMGSPFCSIYHNHIVSLVKAAKIVAISVDYRLAPENPVPAAYEDSWAALQWIASHANGHGPELWLNRHGDFRRVFLAGDSAGANIVHNMAAQAGVEELAGGVKLLGACLVHPYFENSEGSDVGKCWRFVCPTTSGLDDPRINPNVDPRLGLLGCRKVLICVAEKDEERDRGLIYYERLLKSGWDGEVEKGMFSICLVPMG